MKGRIKASYLSSFIYTKFWTLPLKAISSLLDGFATGLAKVNQDIHPLLEQLKERATLSSSSIGDRLVERLSAIVQFILDLRLIENMGKLRSQAIELRTSARALEAEESRLRTTLEKLQKTAGDMRQMLEKKRMNNQMLRDALKLKQNTPAKQG